jgi:hypothetical protein
VIYTSTCLHVKTLAATYSRPDPETLVAHMVLAHPRMALHPCMYRLHEGAAAVATVLIGYNNVRLLPRRPREGDDRDQLLSLH